jgi:hypothetical protein
MLLLLGALAIDAAAVSAVDPAANANATWSAAFVMRTESQECPVMMERLR